ncbi:CocE/NonD family hydrolase [Sulfitobacter mediterraneus]|uniref:CocE/NonD family hydrolase n=1 Tax=Sulfitobacter mediterraneus TaxID=83219 RepID=UPI00193455F3|nr:CocE/NonD family hydrolase [Sulfitobacter mediterraneus]MBM1310932.1 CocE/NonD family hydrolase [Sulfitobacter mediterraneus]MBM1314815.1 CocE/NonD family hydrolase [Sulfitobacter mediterraneus]MBM1323175.1 CocE/NonD family hydrolase [Sulfitobacter mediterraneus]MBM1327087.1 CocE/NonD family hydrolase [Sulfitobacter mediterraneus]MBM1398434.1 CocE/NonD family hydrolase [Sulfitobacter mediterraneus]
MTSTPNALREITEEPDLSITLSDGCRLSARVWMPKDAGDDPVPVILEYLPYRKRDGTCARDALTHPWFAMRGYACLRVDIRGNGDSEGLMEDEYTAQELNDAVEVINWAAAQPWCNGNVGMMGISWGGFNGLQVAALAPDPLKAVITLCSTVDRFADDIHYKGGCLLNENLGWGATMWSYSSRAPDPALRPEDWREMWLERLETEPFLPAKWLRHQRRDAYWRHGSVCEEFSAIKAKVLAVGGWGDAYKNAVPQLVEALPGAKGIVGPWVHKYPHFAVPEPRIGFLQEALRWWDHWLKGLDTGVEDDPDYRAYLMDGVRPAAWYTERPGRWVAEDKGATSHLDTAALHLTDSGLADQAAALDALVSSPAHCGADAGEYCAIWLGPEMPGDQRHDDALSRCFDSDPLTQDMDIVGAPRLSLTVASDHPQAQIAVRLNHIHPDGASTRITYGVLNLSHRNSAAEPQPMQPGVPEEVSFALDHIAYRVPKGHRLRVSISDAYWPLVWPSPEKTELRLTKGAIALPQRPTAGGDEYAFAPPTAADPWQIETLRDENHIRRQETDMVTGRVSLIIEDDFGAVRDADHGLITSSIARENWSIHPDDPASARGTCHWTDELQKGDIRMRTETRCEMWSDSTKFHLTARIEAFEGNDLIYQRDVEDSIDRDNL